MGTAPVPYGATRALPMFGRDGWGRPRQILGVDPNHPCAGNVKFCAYVVGQKYLDAQRGQSSAYAAGSSIAAANKPFIGPSLGGPSSGSANVGFANRPVVADKVITLAAILTVTGSGNYSSLSSTDCEGGGGLGLSVNDYVLYLNIPGVGADTSGPTLVSGQPYFVAASLNTVSGVLNYVARNLATGKISVSVATGQTSTPYNPTSYPGSYFAQGAPYYIGMIFAAGQYHSLGDLLQWALDPWGIFQQPDNFLTAGYATAAQRAALAARASAMGFGAAGLSGAVPLRGWSVAASRALAGSAGAAPLAGRASVAASGRGTLTALASLMGRISGAATGAAAGTVKAPLGARSSSAAVTRARPTGAVPLAARSAGASSASGGMSPLVRLAARAASAAAGRAAGAFAAALSGRITAAARGRARPSLSLWLRARATVAAWLGARVRAQAQSPLITNPRYVATSRAASFIASARAFFTVASPKPNWIVSDMQATRDFSPALAGAIEGEVATFDYGPRLPAGVTIVSVTSIAASVHSGSDPNPQTIVSGAAQIVASPSSGLAAQAVAQTVENGVGGTVYLLVCRVLCSDGVTRSLESHAPFYTPG